MKITMKDVMTANCQIPHAEMLTSNHCAALARELTAMFEAPVPPTGDVEVLAYMRKWAADKEVPQKEKNSNGRMASPFKFKLVPYGPKKVMKDDLELVDRAHVTRLTAGLDGLLAEVERLEKERASAVERCHEFRSSYRSSQDELTKARELLGGMLFAFDDGVGRDWSAPLLDEARKFCKAVEFQSAPAAKGGE